MATISVVWSQDVDSSRRWLRVLLGRFMLAALFTLHPDGCRSQARRASMRPFVFFILTASIAVQTEAYAADNDQFRVLARMVSSHKMLSDECPKYFKIDKDRARVAASVFQETGEQRAGAGEFGMILDSEMQRRSKEVYVTGPRQWCLVQKAVSTYSLPSGGFFAKDDALQPPEWSVSEASRYLSLFRFVGKGCIEIVEVDKSWLEQQAQQVEVGLRRNSTKDLSGLVNAEFKRRSDEIFATGPEQWCRYQHSYLKLIREIGLYRANRK